MLLVGDNPGGVERVTVQPISGKGITSLDPASGMIRLAGGGSVTADGGMITRNAAAGVRGNGISREEAVELIRNAPIYVRATDLNEVNDAVAKTITESNN